MLRPSVLLYGLLLPCLCLLATRCNGEDSWLHHTVMDVDNVYHLYWTPKENSIVFKVEVATKGYVGFGLSPNGGMMNSDIVIGWLKDGKAYFQDRHGVGNTLPPIDKNQDWELTSGTENDTHTSLIFHRKLQTCDPQDMEIDGSTMRVIYAYSQDDPPSEEILPYHDHYRGTRSMILLQAETKKHHTVENLLQWDIKSPNYTITSDYRSIYWCKIVKAPYLEEKHHITRIDPLIQPTHEALVHHLVLYECVGGKPEDYEPYLDHAGHQCYHSNMPNEMRRCDGVFAAWGVGGGPMVFPDHVGMPLDPRPPKYYLLEVHYDNPSYRHGIQDESGFRVYYTPNLREHDAGTFMIGAAVSPRIMIPPNQKSFTVVGHSSKECIGEKMPAEGVKALGIFLHAHLLGHQLSARHFRQEKELPPFAADKNYDFNYQEYHYFKNEVPILPDDQITVECNYDSRERNQTTFGGLTTQEEMCLAFILYYPKIQRYASMSVATMPLIAGLTGVYDFVNTASGFLSSDLWKFRDYMTNFNWSEINVTVFETAMRYSPHQAFCYLGDTNKGLMKEQLTYPQNLEVYRKSSNCISSNAQTTCPEMSMNIENSAHQKNKLARYLLLISSILNLIYITGNY